MPFNRVPRFAPGWGLTTALFFQMRPGQSVRRGGTLGTAQRFDETLVA
jgi:hypothetical protein